MPPAGAAPALEGPPTIEGPIAHLLDANLAILNHFRSNMAAFKVHENTQLLVQFRDNILQILHAMEAMGGTMSQMPQLPVRLNVDLANSFLPSRPAGVLTFDGMSMPPPPQPALNAPGMVPLNGPAPGAGTVPKHALGPPPRGIQQGMPQAPVHVHGMPAPPLPPPAALPPHTGPPGDQGPAAPMHPGLHHAPMGPPTGPPVGSFGGSVAPRPMGMPPFPPPQHPPGPRPPAPEAPAPQ